jgi:hypothetical protein
LQPQLEQLIYVSSASYLMTDEELVDLLGKARRSNEQNDISGMLVYNEGCFIQVLEGPANALTETFRRIEQDPRHSQCIILLRQEINERAFEGWSMGFRSTSRQELEDLTGYVDFFEDCPVPTRGAAAYRLLTSFRKQQDLRFDYVKQ